MAAHGGARPGSGAKKGSHRVHVKELRDALESAVGKPWQEHLSDVYLKLHNHFQNQEFVKEYLIFNENMNKRILQQDDDVTDKQIDDAIARRERIDNLITRRTLATPAVSTPDSVGRSIDSTKIGESDGEK